MFTLSKVECDRYDAFWRKHNKKCKTSKIVITVDHGNGIAQVTKVKCPKCKKTKDITDYSSW